MAEGNTLGITNGRLLSTQVGTREGEGDGPSNSWSEGNDDGARLDRSDGGLPDGVVLGANNGMSLGVNTVALTVGMPEGSDNDGLSDGLSEGTSKVSQKRDKPSNTYR